ncbi:MAG: pyridoxamine 5'-phosphate oxidase [Alphaproteobacteria bacterium]
MNSDFTPPADPWALFADWYALAKQSEPAYPDAMMLATVGADGTPSARAVLMKDFDAKGVVFYTNRESRKGRELALTSKAGICFYWKSLQRQVRIEGNVSLVSDAESDAYFATRPRGSQIGAWASQQSRELKSRSALEQAVQDVEKKYEGRAVPRPSHWGGYRLAPSYFEFWQEREHRLHDRITYTHKPDTGLWAIERIFP